MKGSLLLIWLAYCPLALAARDPFMPAQYPCPSPAHWQYQGLIRQGAIQIALLYQQHSWQKNASASTNSNQPSWRRIKPGETLPDGSVVTQLSPQSITLNAAHCPPVTLLMTHKEPQHAQVIPSAKDPAKNVLTDSVTNTVTNPAPVSHPADSHAVAATGAPASARRRNRIADP